MSDTSYAAMCEYIVSMVGAAEYSGTVRGADAWAALITADGEYGRAALRQAIDHLLRLGVLTPNGVDIHLGAVPLPDDIEAPVDQAEGGRKEVRFYLPAAVWARWNTAAQEADFPLPTWIRLKVDGLLTAGKPAHVPVQGAAAAPLRDRLLAAIGDGCLKKSEVAALARHMGVPARSVHASLGSMVASKRLARVGDEYRRI